MDYSSSKIGNNAMDGITNGSKVMKVLAEQKRDKAFRKWKRTKKEVSYWFCGDNDTIETRGKCFYIGEDGLDHIYYYPIRVNGVFYHEYIL